VKIAAGRNGVAGATRAWFTPVGEPFIDVRQTRLSAQAKLLQILLDLAVGPTKTFCWLGNERLAAMLGVTPRGLRKFLDELERPADGEPWIERVYVDAQKRHRTGIILLRRCHPSCPAADTPQAIEAARAAVLEARAERRRGNRRSLKKRGAEGTAVPTLREPPFPQQREPAFPRIKESLRDSKENYIDANNSRPPLPPTDGASLDEKTEDPETARELDAKARELATRVGDSGIPADVATLIPEFDATDVLNAVGATIVKAEKTGLDNPRGFYRRQLKDARAADHPVPPPPPTRAEQQEAFARKMAAAEAERQKREDEAEEAERKRRDEEASALIAEIEGAGWHVEQDGHRFTVLPTREDADPKALLRLGRLNSKELHDYVEGYIVQSPEPTAEEYQRWRALDAARTQAAKERHKAAQASLEASRKQWSSTSHNGTPYGNADSKETISARIADLRARLAAETNPDMRKFVQSTIDAQEKRLAKLTSATGATS
jgi:hypothetical protein